MKNKLYILFLIVTLQSCLNLTDLEHQAEYIKSYRSFDKELVDHFPLKVPNNWTHVSYGTPDYINEWSSTTGLELEIRITSKNKFEKLKEQLTENVSVLKNSSDSCFLIVDSEENSRLINCESFYPIPQETIYEYNDRNEEWIKVENCEIAILDYKPGKFIESEYLKVKENLPAKWGNGYSKGYAFNNSEQTIMYWLIIW